MESLAAKNCKGEFEQASLSIKTSIEWQNLKLKQIILMKLLVSWMFNDTHRGREPEAILIKKRVADWQSWLIWLRPSSYLSYSSIFISIKKPSVIFISSFISLLPFLLIFFILSQKECCKMAEFSNMVMSILSSSSSSSLTS